MPENQTPIILINLDRSPARLERMSGRLQRLGLAFERLPAADGTALTESHKRRLNPKRFWQIKKSLSEIACYQSHLNALSLVVERQLPRAIILEDDADFEDDFTVWAHPDCPMPPDTDVLKLEGFGAQNTIRIPIFSYRNRTVSFAYKSSGGTAAYLVTYHGAKKALKKLNIMRGQIDDDLCGYWKNGLRIYEVFPFPAWQDRIDQATLRDPVSRPLSLRASRYVMRSYFKLKRFVIAARRFGVVPLIAHSNWAGFKRAGDGVTAAVRPRPLG